MRRRAFIAGLASTVFSAPPISRAQQPSRLPRLAIASAVTPVEEISTYSPAYRAFFDELARLGYIEGRTLAVERWSAEGRSERFGEIAEQVAQSRPDVIFAVSARLVQHLKSANSETPIVAYTLDPVGYGFAASLARPGANVTGVSSDTGIDLVGKHLELLKEISPRASRIGSLTPKAVLGSPYFKALQEAANRQGTAIVLLPLESPITEAEYQRLFALAAAEVDAVLVADTPEIFFHRNTIAELARVHRIPAIYPNTTYARSGGLIAYGHDAADWLRRAAHFVNRILKGANPGDLPFEQPSRLYLVVNLKAAQATRITIPAAVLARADEVIE